jgi:hypothetical protein
MHKIYIYKLQLSEKRKLRSENLSQKGNTTVVGDGALKVLLAHTLLLAGAEKSSSKATKTTYGSKC